MEGGIDMIALIIIGYLVGFVITLKFLKKKFPIYIYNDEKIFFILAGIFFPITLFFFTIVYIGRLLIKFYDWL